MVTIAAQGMAVVMLAGLLWWCCGCKYAEVRLTAAGLVVALRPALMKCSYASLSATMYQLVCVAVVGVGF
jgi:hypothetical protein